MSDKPSRSWQLDAEDQRRFTEAGDFYSQIRQSQTPPDLNSFLDAEPEATRPLLICALLKAEIEIQKGRLGILPTQFQLRNELPQCWPIFASEYQNLPPHLQVPDKLGPYVLRRMLPHGAQALAALARKEVDDTSQVFVKFTSDERLINHISWEKQFLLEFLEHPNIATYVDHGVADGWTYLVLVYYEGRDLRDELTIHSYTSLEICRMLRQMANAVASMHGEGLAHCDIKPDNIRVGTKGGVRLLDFGLACNRNGDGYPLRLVDTYVGSPAYMAPELSSPRRRIDYALCDIFSVGATMYFALTGKDPKRLSACNGQSAKRFDEAALALCDPELASVVMKATAARPSDRYRTIEDFAGQLDTYICRAAAPKTTEPATELAPSPQGKYLAGAPYRSFAFISAVVAVLIAVASGLWYFASVYRNNAIHALGERNSRVHEIAEAQGINLSELSASDFTLSVSDVPPFGRTQWNDDASLAPKKAVGKIVIGFDDRLLDLAGWLEYRVGNRPWQRVLVDGANGSLYGELQRRDLEVGGPVQLRLASGDGSATDEVAGPFTMDIDVVQELKKARTRRIHEAFSKAVRAQWLVQSAGRWAFDERFVKEDFTNLKEIRFGASDASLTVAMPLEKYVGNRRDPALLAYSVDAMRNLNGELANVLGRLANSRQFYGQLVSSEGEVSSIQRFAWRNAYGHDGSVPSAQDLLNYPPNDTPPATLIGWRLDLKGIAKVAAAIRELRIGPRADDLARVVRIKYLDEREPVGSPAVTTARPTAKVDAFDLLEINESRSANAIAVPPHWRAAYIQVVFSDGSVHPPLKVANTHYFPGFEAKSVTSNNPDLAPQFHLYFKTSNAQEAELQWMCIPSTEQYGETFCIANGETERLTSATFDAPRASIRFDPPLGHASGYGQATLLFRNQQNTERGPFSYRIPNDQLQIALAEANLPLVERNSDDLVVGYRLDAAQIKQSEAKLHFGTNTQVFEDAVMQSPEVRASHGPTIALAGKQFHRLWSAVGAIKLGTRADVLEQTVSTRVSLSEVLSDSDWTTRPPVFVVTYPGEVKELYGAFELINGVTTKPFLIAIEELE